MTSRTQHSAAGRELKAERDLECSTRHATGTDGRAPRDVSANRTCLTCQGIFLSEGFGNRICPRCKSGTAWRGSAVDGFSMGRKRGAR